MKKFALLLTAILAGSFAWPAHATEAPKNVNLIAILLDNKIQGFLFISDHGSVKGSRADDCADTPECVTEVKRLNDAKQVIIVRLKSNTST